MTTGTVQAGHQTEDIQGYGTLADMLVYNVGAVGGNRPRLQPLGSSGAPPVPP